VSGIVATTVAVTEANAVAVLRLLLWLHTIMVDPHHWRMGYVVVSISANGINDQRSL
jgi:hypothetical protein